MRITFHLEGGELDKKWVDLIKKIYGDKDIVIDVSSADEGEMPPGSTFIIENMEVSGDVGELNIHSPSDITDSEIN